MDKKPDTPMLASAGAPGLLPSSRSAVAPEARQSTAVAPEARSSMTAPPAAPVEPAAPRVAPPRVEPEWGEGRLEEAIFRPTLNDDGKVEIQILPPTLYNLTHPKEEDVVSQGNRHFRTADPIGDILRRQVEKTRPGAGVFSELIFYWDDPTLVPSCPDVCVVFDLKRPPEEIEPLGVLRIGSVKC